MKALSVLVSFSADEIVAVPNIESAAMPTMQKILFMFLSEKPYSSTLL